VPDLDWQALGRGSGTIAAYMASRTLGQVAARLIAAGLPATTQAAAVENATRPHERVLFAPLSDLAAALEAQGFTGPTMVLIGQTISRTTYRNGAVDTAQAA
jgi:siroheme synthase